MKCTPCQNTCSLTRFSPGQISDSRPLNVFMLADDERCQITINPLTRSWSAPLLNSNYVAELQARGVWTHFVAWWKTIHHGWQSPRAADTTCARFWSSWWLSSFSEQDECPYLPLKLHERAASLCTGKKQRAHWNIATHFPTHCDLPSY